MKVTTILVSLEVRDAIKKDGVMGESYDDVLRRRYSLPKGQFSKLKPQINAIVKELKKPTLTGNKGEKKSITNAPYASRTSR